MRRVTRDGLIATIGFEVALYARHQGVHVASGGCESCQRTSLELKRIALSVVPGRETGCLYQVFEGGSGSGPSDGPGRPTDVCVVLRVVSRGLPLGVAQLSCLRSIEEALRRVGGSRRARR